MSSDPCARSSMLAYAVAVFLSSFLLFLIQPLIGKYILPWFGGTPGVWTSCLLFFQVMLLVGYAYAHLLATYLKPRTQAVVHCSVLVVTLLCLPMIPAETWKSASVENPTGTIVLLLLVTVGAPYLVLSSSAPLIQKWFSLANPGRSPYRLYAISNAASLGALLAYPFLFERFLKLPTQCYAWSAAYVAYVVSLVVCGAIVYRQCQSERRSLNPEAGEQSESRSAPSALDQVLWILLSACGTLLLMATTNQITQDVAPIPFLWVLPLSLYLLSFVICFDHPRWYHRNGFTWLFIGSVVLAAFAQVYLREAGVAFHVAKYSLCLFAGCMCCHGELILRRPPTRWVTKYYLMISLGGSLGGCFVALAAPALFDDYREYWLGLGATCLLVLVGRRHDDLAPRFEQFGLLRLGGVATAAVAVLVLLVAWLSPSGFLDGDNQLVAADRNFYGSLRILRADVGSPERARTVMSHGTTRHGFQYANSQKSDHPTAYYDRESGVGLALLNHPKCRRDEPLRMGVVGLGVGTLATYAKAGDDLVFYEINPLVVSMAENYFSFQRNAAARGAHVNVRLGDGRLLLEEELATVGSRQYDLLAVDAFSSDSVPVHLLTQECFENYWQHLAPSGILAVHISNLYLDLRPVVAAHAAEHNAYRFLVHHENENTTGGDDVTLSSTWVLMTLSEEVAKLLEATGRVAELELPKPSFRPWTDDFSSLYEVLR